MKIKLLLFFFLTNCIYAGYDLNYSIVEEFNITKTKSKIIDLNPKKVKDMFYFVPVVEKLYWIHEVYINILEEVENE